MSTLAETAARWGIEPEYIDAHGRRQVVADEALERVVGAVSRDLELPEEGALPPVLVMRQGRQTRLAAPPSSSGIWQLFQGPEPVTTGEVRDGKLTLPEALANGVYRLSFAGRKGSTEVHSESSVLVSPERAYEPPITEKGGRVWVLAVQLYSVRSARNWGHGDFTDLKALLQLAAEVGAAGVALNPLHALFDDRPTQSSPYAPNSRQFLNILYIDVDAVPEYAEQAGARSLSERAGRGSGDEIDYAAVADAKIAALRLAYARFREKPNRARQRDFKAYRQERGRALSRFAAFETLRRKFPAVWWEWPDEWRTPDDARIEKLRRRERDTFEFYEYVQWIADRQLGACRDLAQRLGLPVGLYLDVAVGVNAGGADCWSDQEAYIQGISVGAPPDLLNTAGQDWGLAAFNPNALPASGFQPFRDMLAASMRYAGAIRIDHVLGLYRIYLVPYDLGPRKGAYLRFPFEAMLAVVAQESVARQCLVIGEDLGTVPGELRDILGDWNIWSYLVMLFERHSGSGGFRHPHEYKPGSLVTFSTHDLPTFSGWLSGHDLEVKRGLGIDPGETNEEREVARGFLRQVLDECGFGHEHTIQFENVLRFLARTQSKLLVVSIEDVLGIRDQPNIPGTIDEHPNWRQVLPVPLEQLGDHEGLRMIARVMADEGRSAPRPEGS